MCKYVQICANITVTVCSPRSVLVMRTYCNGATGSHSTEQKTTSREHRTSGSSMEADFFPNVTKSPELPMALKFLEEILPEIREVTSKWETNSKGGLIGETWWRVMVVVLPG